ncbi:X-ray repair cross-complementing protein 6-like isoform X1 [Dendropsophus ebraccatus]|uniref:X-ray repair cross-complementing protein 6-like isoform X1 n=1 Tax=Dendropsophus ebraccatus TaxID=150705 RepID=UPI003830FFF1
MSEVMTEWRSCCGKEKGDEDEEQEEEEKAKPVDFRSGGRDCLIFLIDASKQMFRSLSDGDFPPFDIALQCIRNVYTSKIISNDRDLLAVVFFGSKESKSADSFKHIYVLHDLDTPGAQRVLDFDKYREEKGREYFSETIGHSSDFSLGEALWHCTNLFSNVKMKLSHKRIMLFTNEDNPHAGDSAKITQAVTKAKDLRELGIVLDLMHLEKEGGFDISLFYRDIVNTDDDEDLGVQYKASRKLDDLMRKVRTKEHKKRALWRIPLKLADDLYLAVGIYNLIQKPKKPAIVRLCRKTNQSVKTKVRLLKDTGSLRHPSDMRKAQTYGKQQIVMEKKETKELKRFDDPSLVLIGFKPISLLKTHHFIQPAQFVYPEESLVSGSTTLFQALLIKCLERQVMAICRYTPCRNSPPRFVALVPQEEKLDDENVQVKPPGFNLTSLPYANDIRKCDYPKVVPPSKEQVDKMKEIVHKLSFMYRSDAFENPVLQQHLRNFESLALNLTVAKTNDLTSPKTGMIDNLMGSLAEEFKELVYPPGYNPEVKAVKRKQGDDGGQAAKKAKTETSISEADLRAHIKDRTLGKLSIPVLKEWCQTFGLKGGKKQEFMDALIDYFEKDNQSKSA